MFYDRFAELCREKGVKPGTACAEMGVSRSLASKWKNTNTEKPSAEVLEKMSAYFKISIDEILKIDTKKAPTVNNDDERKDSNEVELHPLLKFFYSLNEEGQKRLMDYAEDLTYSPHYKKRDSFSTEFAG